MARFFVVNSSYELAKEIIEKAKNKKRENIKGICNHQTEFGQVFCEIEAQDTEILENWLKEMNCLYDLILEVRS